MRPDDHSYTVDDSSFGWSGGRYVSTIPMTAGKNAGRALMRRVESDASLAKYRSARSVSIKLRETTKVAGAKEKIYFYKVTKVSIPLKDRVTKKFGGVEFTPEYTYDVKSIDAAAFGRSSSRA
jgi:hypothetical protein